MSVDPNEMQSVVLPLVDRLVGPLVNRLDQMDARQREDTQQLHSKLDGVIAVTHEVRTTASTVEDLRGRMAGLEEAHDDHGRRLAKTDGRNEVIVWVLGLIGAPVTVALCLAGIAKLFNIDVGG